jgi:hypothetical protein
VEILRHLRIDNLKLKIVDGRFYLLQLLLVLAFFLASCSRKPEAFYVDGMKSFAAGKYAEAQEHFANGIRKNGSDSLYSGFIAANLVTGKYDQVNAAYNQFTDGIRSSLVQLYGERVLQRYGITTKIIPYKTSGGNQLPPDFPLTVAVQARADIAGYFTLKQKIDNLIKK